VTRKAACKGREMHAGAKHHSNRPEQPCSQSRHGKAAASATNEALRYAIAQTPRPGPWPRQNTDRETPAAGQSTQEVTVVLGNAALTTESVTHKCEYMRAFGHGARCVTRLRQSLQAADRP